MDSNDVDWEIKGTLDKEHGLIGVRLPGAPVNPFANTVTVPDRLHENVQSGYALWITWAQIISGPIALKAYIEDALNTTTRPKRLIMNGREMMQRNATG